MTIATKLKSNFKAAWKAYDPETFAFNMEQLHKINPEIQAYLERIELQKWARAFSPKPRYGVMTSNIAESMNNKDKEAREMPVTALMEWLRSVLQTWFFQRREKAARISTHLATHVEKQIRERIQESSTLTVTSIPIAYYSISFSYTTLFYTGFFKKGNIAYSSIHVPYCGIHSCGHLNFKNTIYLPN